MRRTKHLFTFLLLATSCTSRAQPSTPPAPRATQQTDSQVAVQPKTTKSSSDAGLGASVTDAALARTPADYIPGSFWQVHRLTRRHVKLMLCPNGVLQVMDTGKTTQGTYELAGNELKVRLGKKNETYRFKPDPQFLAVRDQLLKYDGPPDCSALTARPE